MGREEEKKNRLKSKGVYVNVDNEARCESALPEHVNKEMQGLLGLKRRVSTQL